MTYFDMSTLVLGEVLIHLFEVERRLKSALKEQFLLVKDDILWVLGPWPKQRQGAGTE